GIRYPLVTGVQTCALPILPILQRAMAERSDLLERQAALLSAQVQIDVVTGEHLPSLDLTADYYPYRERYSDFQEQIHWDALLTQIGRASCRERGVVVRGVS